MGQSVIERFTTTYERLDGTSLHLLDALYGAEVWFRDPFHEVRGLPALREYFERLYKNVDRCTFSFEDRVADEQQAMLTWTMHLRHPRLAGGQEIHVPGCSHIRFRDKVYEHRDFFDAGAMLYERLPVLGSVVRLVKARL
jgi:hypothetical protein